MRTSSPNIAHSAWMHDTLWNAIFASVIGYKIDVIDTLYTLRFNNDVDFQNRLATALEMRLEQWVLMRMDMINDRYQQNSHRWQTWQLGFRCHRRGIELVFKSLDWFTVRLFHNATLFCCYMYLLFETSPGWLQGLFIYYFTFFIIYILGGSLTSIWIWWAWRITQLQRIYYLVPCTNLWVADCFFTESLVIFIQKKVRFCNVGRKYGIILIIVLSHMCHVVWNRYQLNSLCKILFRLKNRYQGSVLPTPLERIPLLVKSLWCRRRCHIQYIPRNMHTVLLCFALLRLCNRS